MGHYVVSSAIVVSSVLFIFLGPLSTMSISAQAQTDGPTVASSVVFVMQGENDIVPGSLTDHDFYALKVVTYNLPHNESRVYTVIPATATSINLWTPSGDVNQTAQGWITSGEHAGQYFVDVPSTHVRTANYTNQTSGESGFNASGSQHINTTYADGALRPQAGLDAGQYLSTIFEVVDANTIVSATVTYQGNSTSNLTSWVSNDGGGNWTSCQNGSPIDFLAFGSSLRVRFDFIGNVSAGFEPNVTSFQVSARYVLEQTLFVIHVSYIWTENFIDGVATINVSEALPFDGTGSYYLMLYLVNGYTAQGEGLSLVFDENGTMSTYPEKAFYFNNSHPGGQVVDYTVDVIAPVKKNQAILYTIPVVLTAVVVLAYVYVRRLGRAGKVEEKGVVKEEPAPKTGSSKADEQRRTELIARKKAMLAEIDEIKGRMSAREITKEEAERELARLRKEFKSVRNELNRISRRLEATESVGSPEVLEEPASEYESILASLAKIDEDFERGRLPEGVYKSLRKDYVSKAAAALAARKASIREAPSPLETEKTKLMEAIVALDDEREKGEIDEKVYADLRSSYRKKLIELMKKSDKSEE